MSTNELTPRSLKNILSFPFRGEQWPARFLIGVGLTLAGFIVPIVPGVFQLGYFARIMRRAIRGEEIELPAWDDWGKLGMDGLRLIGVSLVYMLPGLVVLFGGMALYIVGFFGFMIVTETADRFSKMAIVMPLLMFILMGIMFLSMFLGYFLLILGAVPLQVAQARTVDQEQFSAAFHLNEISKLFWRNKAGYFVVWVIIIGLLGIFYFVSMMFYMTIILSWAMFLIAIPFGFYILAVMGVLLGQAYRENLEAPAA